MDSLNQWNAFSSESITFDDQRTPRTVFDRINAVNQVININQHELHNVPIGIEITEIIRPSDASPQYIIDLSTCPGATSTWNDLPVGCSITSPSSGVFVLSGMDTVEKWDAVKSPQIAVPMEYTGTFTYTATIRYSGTTDKTWDIVTTVNDIDNMTPLDDFYFEKGYSGPLLGAPTIEDTYNTSWTVTIVPSHPEYLISLTASGTGGTFTQDPETFEITIEGTRTEVNSYMSTLNIEIGPSVITDWNITYTAINDTTSATDIKIQYFYTLEYIGPVLSDGSYTFNTVSLITGTPNITFESDEINPTYTVVVTPEDPTLVRTLSLFNGSYKWLEDQFIPNPDPDQMDQWGGGWLDAAFSYNASWLAVASDLDNNQQSPYKYGSVIFFKRNVENEYVLNEIFLPDTGTADTYLESPDNIQMSDDGLTCSFEAGTTLPQKTIYVFTRTDDEWSKQTSISTSRLNCYQLSTDGNTLIFVQSGSTPTYSSIKIYKRSGGTWSLYQTITMDTYSISNSGMWISQDLTSFVVADSSFNSNIGKVYCYRYSTSTTQWALEHTFTYPGSSAYPKFGSYVHLSRDGNSINIGASNTGGSLDAANIMYSYIRTIVAGSPVWSTNSITTPIKSVAFESRDSRFRYITNTFNTTETEYYYEYDEINDGVTTTIKQTFDSDSLDNNQYKRFNGVSGNNNYICYSNSEQAVPGKTSVGAIAIGVKTVNGSANYVHTPTVNALTLTGSKEQINYDLDHIQVSAKYGLTIDFNLIYTVTVPTLQTDSRTQTIRYTTS